MALRKPSRVWLALVTKESWSLKQLRIATIKRLFNLVCICCIITEFSVVGFGVATELEKKIFILFLISFVTGN